jgi:adenylate cyclase
VLDTDGRVRRGLFYLTDSTGNPMFSFGFKLAYRYLQQQGVKVDQDSRNQIYAGSTVFPRFRTNDGGYTWARDEGYQVLLNYRNESQGFRTISVTDVLNNRIPAGLLRDRVVLIGSTAESLKDIYYTPYNSQILGAPKRMAGVVIHANLISQIISSTMDDRQLIRTWPEWGEWLWILGWTTLGGFICWRQRLSSGSTRILFLKRFRLFVAGVCLMTSVYLAFLLGWWIPLVPALMGLAGAAFSVTGYLAHNATEMRKTFGRYLTDEVVANLLETPSGLQLGGERRKVTVLMSDVRGFSALSEWLPPEQVVALLNQYLGVMADVVDQYKGTINEFIGDGIFVMFGAPVSRPDDAQRAIACAIAMQQAMSTVNEKNRQNGLPAIEMGIGINTGEVVVGNVGSQRRAKYTVIGRHVNLAARIESYTVGGQILVSEDTLKDAECEVQILSELRVEPKGIRTPMTVYEVVGLGGKYQLALPVIEDQMQPLNRKVLVQYTVLEGKHAVGNLFQGQFTQLSKSSAELETAQDLDILSNLKLHLSGSDRTQSAGELYAKVIRTINDRTNRYIIRFTSVPPEVAIALQSFLNSTN